jgi:hypothetical protein
MPVFNNALAGAAGSGGADAGYTIQRSLRFNDDDSAYLQRTFAQGNQKTWTWSAWVKRHGGFGTRQVLFGNCETGNKENYIGFDTNNELRYQDWDYASYANLKTSQVFRDPSAWYHIVVAVDTTQSTSSDRVKMYVNGVRVTQFATSSYPGSNRAGNLNHSVNNHRIARASNNDPYPADVSIADMHFVDGQQLDPDGVFGEFDADTGVWNPIEFAPSSPNDGTIWSNSTVTTGTIDSSYPLTNAFNGSLGTPNTRSSGADTTVTITLPKAISFSSKVRIYQNQNGTANINNESTVSTSSGGASWVTVFTGSGSLTSLTLTSTGGDTVSLYAIEVDGVLLIDGSTINIGLNGFHLDFDPDAGEVYSNGVSTYLAAFNSTYNDVTTLFDGGIGMNNRIISGNSNGAGIKFVPSTAITGSIELYLRNGDTVNSTFSYSLDNGSTFTNLTTSSSGSYVSIGNQTISATNGIIVRHITTAGTNSVDWRGIRVDGTVLVDHSAPGIDASGNGNHWTPINLEDSFISRGTPDTGGLDQYMPSGVSPATDPSQLADTSNRTHFFVVNQDNSWNLTVVATATSITTGSSVYDGWGSNNPTTTLNNGTITPNSSGTDSSVSGKNLATNTFTGLTVGNTYTISTKNGGAGNPHRVHYVTGATVQNQPVIDTNSLLDSPTNHETDSGNNVGNYASWNPLISTNNLTNGNLSVVQPVNSTVASRYSTIGMSAGKWYWEIAVVAYANTVFGVRTPSGGSLETPYDSSGYGMGWRTAGGFFVGASNTSGSLSLTAGDLLGLAFDADAGTLAFYKNGSLARTLTAASSYIGETWFAGSQDSVGGSSDHHVNFGQRPFSYPPGGTGGPAATFKSLCTQNLDSPLIEDPSEYFDTKLWTGNGGEQIVGSGIRYSDYVTGDIDSSHPAYRAFRNTTNVTGVRTATAGGATIVFQPPSPIEFSNSFKIWAARDSTTATFTVTHAGGTTDFSSSVATGTTQTAVDLAQISGVTSPITKITIVSTGTNPRFSGIEVDGSMLIDSTADPINFSPDFTWIKQRSASRAHALFDTVRGANKRLQSSSTGLETTHTDQLTAFSSDNFKVGSNNTVNADTGTYAAWNWDGGDLATNSAYNQSQNWTSLLTSSAGTINNPGNSFDGSTATTSQLPSTSSGSYIQFGATLTGVTKLEVYQRSASDVSGTGIQTYNNCPAAQWVELTLTSSTISNIRFEKNTNDPGIRAIRVNDKILVDKGVIPVGSLNSSLYNQSATWTNDVTTNSGTSWFGGAPANAFDGSTSTFVQGAIGYDLTFTPTTGIAVTSSMRIWADSGSGFGVGNGPYTITYNGTQVYSGSMWSSPYTITAAAGTTFNSLVIAPSGGEAMRLFAVEIDGRLLINSNVSVANVPSIPSTVRANPTAGFSIVKYTSTNTNNATVAHGLNADPEFILIKNIDSSEFWWAIHKYMNNDPWNDSTLRLNSSDGTTGVYGTFNNVAPTSSVVNLSNTTTPAPNKGTDDKIMYSFAPVKGYSAFGSYESSTPFVYTGFRPAYLAIKSTSGGRNWIVLDSARDQFNRTDRALLANDPSIEDDNSTYSVDFLSNGFKVLGSNGQITGDSRYIYLAFAENPFKYARAR